VIHWHVDPVIHWHVDPVIHWHVDPVIHPVGRVPSEEAS
jgi:hypothetical protein